MQYLTYGEYSEMGGVLDLAAFNRNIDRACSMIDIRTQNRLEKFNEIPNIVKIVCADLLEYISMNIVNKSVTSKSQSAGGVSESESYAVKTAEDYSADIDEIFEPLGSVETDSGVPINYRGALL
jgi:hypothetical protein